RSDHQGRTGIVAAGFLKLLIPFFSIGSGIAAFYLFRSELPHQTIDPDTAFSELVKLVVPVGTGIIGLIAAGLLGAILSSIDSMMNSAATLFTMDIYKQFIRPQATDRELIRVGRLTIVALVAFAAWMAINVLNPNSDRNFFLTVADYQNYFTPGILVAFALGMFWRRATATGAFASILAGVLCSWLVEAGYNRFLGPNPAFAAYLGAELSFFHRVVAVILLCAAVHVLVSLVTTPDREKGRLVWTDLGGHAPRTLVRAFSMIGLSIGIYALLGIAIVRDALPQTTAGLLAVMWTWIAFSPVVLHSVRARRRDTTNDAGVLRTLLSEDRFWASILCSLAVFMLYYFR
ncbi:MAG: hypothetical protein KF861_22190, partial [Planctomycetaceae bacterium]|nr:hypothetical protein [Planctomycetaceae bacterium]